MDVLPTDTNSMTWVSSRNAPNLLIGNMIQLPLIFWAWTKRCGPKIVQTQIQLLVKSSMAIYWIKYTVCRCMSMYWILYALSTVGVLWLNLTWRAHMFFTWPTCCCCFLCCLLPPLFAVAQSPRLRSPASRISSRLHSYPTASQGLSREEYDGIPLPWDSSHYITMQCNV